MSKPKHEANPRGPSQSSAPTDVNASNLEAFKEAPMQLFISRPLVRGRVLTGAQCGRNRPESVESVEWESIHDLLCFQVLLILHPKR